MAKTVASVQVTVQGIKIFFKFVGQKQELITVLHSNHHTILADYLNSDPSFKPCTNGILFYEQMTNDRFMALINWIWRNCC